jgi:hypothetical protein
MNPIFSALPALVMGVFAAPTRGVYTPTGGAPVEVALDFDQSFRQVVEQDGVPVEVMRKAATFKTSDIPSPRHGDTLLFLGETYTVRGVIPSGGLVTVVLSE